MISRRRLVGAGAGVLSLPATHARKQSTSQSAIDLVSAAYIGQRFLHQHPQWNSIHRVRAVVLDGCVAQESTIAGRICQDFATDNTVIVDGWVLSLMEACVCALIALGEAPETAESGSLAPL